MKLPTKDDRDTNCGCLLKEGDMDGEYSSCVSNGTLHTSAQNLCMMSVASTKDIMSYSYNIIMNI